MNIVQQGSLLHLSGIDQTVLVLSREFFNRTGMLVVCPVRKNTRKAALNIQITTENFTGFAMLDQMRGIDIRARHYSTLGEIPFEQIQNISDAAQGIFDYYPFSI